MHHGLTFVSQRVTDVEHVSLTFTVEITTCSFPTIIMIVNAKKLLMHYVLTLMVYSREEIKQ